MYIAKNRTDSDDQEQGLILAAVIRERHKRSETHNRGGGTERIDYRRDEMKRRYLGHHRWPRMPQFDISSDPVYLYSIIEHLAHPSLKITRLITAFIYLLCSYINVRDDFCDYA